MEVGEIKEIKHKKTGIIEYLCAKCNILLIKTHIENKRVCPKCLTLWDLTSFNS